MIDQVNLPSWGDIFSRLGEKPPQRNRTRCPLCAGASVRSQAFSCHEERGFHCFRCGRRGDKLRFVQEYLRCDFKSALRWMGLEPGRPPKPDFASLRRKAAIERVRHWVRRTGRRLRDEYLTRQRISRYAQERLVMDSEDQVAWELLRIAYDGEARNEFLLDEIDLCRGDDERLNAWRLYRDVS